MVGEGHVGVMLAPQLRVPPRGCLDPPQFSLPEPLDITQGQAVELNLIFVLADTRSAHDHQNQAERHFMNSKLLTTIGRHRAGVFLVSAMAFAISA